MPVRISQINILPLSDAAVVDVKNALVTPKASIAFESSTVQTGFEELAGDIFDLNDAIDFTTLYINATS